MYARIMVPLDGSTFSERALPIATRLARRTGAALHIVTVFEPISNFSSSNWEAATREWGELYLAGVAERVRDTLPGKVTTSLLQGPATGALLDEARAARADLTVMATHGRGSVARAWIGSVADEFSRAHDGPVLLVRPRESSTAPSFHDRVDILIPLDGSELSEGALSHAVELGEIWDGVFHLTRVVIPPPVLASPYLPGTMETMDHVVDAARNEAAEYLEGLANRLRRRGLQVATSVVVDQQPAHGILSEAEAVGAEFIVMATHGHRGVRRALLGSTADKVLRATDVPLLLYRPRGVPKRAAS